MLTTEKIGGTFGKFGGNIIFVTTGKMLFL